VGLPSKEFRTLKNWVRRVWESWKKVSIVEFNVGAKKKDIRALLAGFLG